MNFNSMRQAHGGWRLLCKMLTVSLIECDLMASQCCKYSAKRDMVMDDWLVLRNYVSEHFVELDGVSQ